jgi:hypothetical protein
MTCSLDLLEQSEAASAQIDMSLTSINNLIRTNPISFHAYCQTSFLTKLL